MDKNKTFLCESAQKSAEHYHIMIWTIFSVGVALSLWILNKVWSYKSDFTAIMHIIMSVLGFLILFYCILAIESFAQKKRLMYEIYGKEIKKLDSTDFKKLIAKLPFFGIDWIAETILLFIFSLYVFLFGYIFSMNSLTIPDVSGHFVAFILFVFSLFLLSIVIANLVKRPMGYGGNWIEKFRKVISGNNLEYYEKMLQ